MGEDILGKYVQGGGPDQASDRGSNPVGSTDQQEPDATMHGSLITLQGSIAAMLDLRFRDGKRLAVPYGYIMNVGLDPSTGIMIRTSDQEVMIAGRNLTPIYTAITNHTALAIVESPSQYDEGGDQPFVEAITVGSGLSS